MKVFPTHSYGGSQCYAFTTKKQRDAWKTLTGHASASAKKLKALTDLGVKIEFEDDTTSSPEQSNAIQQPN